MNLLSTVSLARSVAFSFGRNAAVHSWPRRLQLPHGYDCVLWVYYAGAVGADDGMVANIADVKPLLAQAIEPLDNAMLTASAPLGKPPSAENIVEFLWAKLPAQLQTGYLSRLELQLSARLRVEKTIHTMRLTRHYEFAAAHRLCSPELSDAENMALYGKCSNLAGHGHNYGLAVTIEGTPDAVSGFIMPPTELDRIVEEEVFTRFDHKHLNEDCPEFENLIPTSENFARVLFAVLEKPLSGEGRRLAKIGLKETQKNYFEVEA